MGFYIQYIYNKIVVLASDPVGGRSRATELPCFIRSSRRGQSLPHDLSLGIRHSRLPARREYLMVLSEFFIFFVSFSATSEYFYMICVPFIMYRPID